MVMVGGLKDVGCSGRTVTQQVRRLSSTLFSALLTLASGGSRSLRFRPRIGDVPKMRYGSSWALIEVCSDVVVTSSTNLGFVSALPAVGIGEFLVQLPERWKSPLR
jgi:hypothetical protein